MNSLFECIDFHCSTRITKNGIRFGFEYSIVSSSYQHCLLYPSILVSTKANLTWFHATLFQDQDTYDQALDIVKSQFSNVMSDEHVNDAIRDLDAMIAMGELSTEY